MYLGVVHMKYKGITEWWVAGTGFEELQRKAPNWLSQGSRALSEGILLYAYKKDSYIFFSFYTLCVLELVSKTSWDVKKTFHITHFHIFVSMLTFISNSHFWWKGETISVTVWHWLYCELWIAPSGLEGNLSLSEGFSNRFHRAH